MSQTCCNIFLFFLLCIQGHNPTGLVNNKLIIRILSCTQERRTCCSYDTNTCTRSYLKWGAHIACSQIIHIKLKSLSVDWSPSCGNASTLGNLIFLGFSSNVCSTKTQKSWKGNFEQLTQERKCHLNSSPKSYFSLFLSWLLIVYSFFKGNVFFKAWKWRLEWCRGFLHSYLIIL